MIFIILLIYGTNKVKVMLEKGDDTVQEVVKRMRLDRNKTFSQEEMGISFAIYMVDFSTGRIMTKEDTEGYYEDWSAQLLGFDAFSFEVTNYVDLPFETCPAEFVKELIDTWDISNADFEQ